MFTLCLCSMLYLLIANLPHCSFSISCLSYQAFVSYPLLCISYIYSVIYSYLSLNYVYLYTSSISPTYVLSWVFPTSCVFSEHYLCFSSHLYLFTAKYPTWSVSPTYEEGGMWMSSVCKEIRCWRERGQWGGGVNIPSVQVKSRLRVG